MKRLTERDENGVALCNEKCGKNGLEFWFAIIDRLAAYEDALALPDGSVMSPAEVAELAKAKQEGRILPELPQDMGNLLEPLKVQSALTSEMRKLEFRKANRPKDVSILDYTIIAALTKVLSESSSSEKARRERDGDR